MDPKDDRTCVMNAIDEIFMQPDQSRLFVLAYGTHDRRSVLIGRGSHVEQLGLAKHLEIFLTHEVNRGLTAREDAQKKRGEEVKKP